MTREETKAAFPVGTVVIRTEAECERRGTEHWVWTLTGTIVAHPVLDTRARPVVAVTWAGTEYVTWVMVDAIEKYSETDHSGRWLGACRALKALHTELDEEMSGLRVRQQWAELEAWHLVQDEVAAAVRRGDLEALDTIYEALPPGSYKNGLLCKIGDLEESRFWEQQAKDES